MLNKRAFLSDKYHLSFLYQALFLKLKYEKKTKKKLYMKLALTCYQGHSSNIQFKLHNGRWTKFPGKNYHLIIVMDNIQVLD